MIASAARFADPVSVSEALVLDVYASAGLTPHWPARGARHRARCSSSPGRAAPTGRRAGPRAGRASLGDRPSAQLGGRWIVMLAKPSLADARRRGQRRRNGGAGAELDGEGAARPARRHRAPRVPRGAARARALRTRASSTALRRRSTHSRSRSSSATPTCGRLSPCGRRFRQPRIPMRSTRSSTPPADGAPTSASPASTGGGDRRAARHRGRSRPPVRPRRAAPGPRRPRPGRRCERAPEPDGSGRPERHGTEMAGLVAGSGGPAGLQGVAPGSRAPPHPRGRLAARCLGRGLRLRPLRPAAGRDRARSRPERGR